MLDRDIDLEGFDFLEKNNLKTDKTIFNYL